MMLEQHFKDQLKVYLERLAQPITLVASLDHSDDSKNMRALLQDIAQASTRITIRDDGNNQRKPSFYIEVNAQHSGIEFAGLPLGHEFTSLVLALLQASGYPPKISEQQRQQIQAIQGQRHFETYVSLSCHNCPDVVQALNTLSALNPNISHTMIEGALFEDEVSREKIMAVPTVRVNGQAFGQGRMTLDEILQKINPEQAQQAAEKIAEAEPLDMVIVGGGPAGAAAAIYAARKGIRTAVISERFGGQVLDTLSIENLISVPETQGPQLAKALENHVQHYAVDIVNGQRAKRLIEAEKNGGFIGIELENGLTVKSRSVVIATGARWREMNVPGEKEYRGKGVAYCPHCDGPLFKGKRVAVIGGGNSGIEAAIDLAGIVEHVTVLEFDKNLRADAVLQAKAKSMANITIITEAQTTEVLGNGEKMVGLSYIDRRNHEENTLNVEGVFVQIGLLPNTDWLKGHVNLSNRGEIEVDHKGQSSMPGVFAAGDATTAPYKQIIIAMGSGANAALGAFDYLIRQQV